MLAWADTRNGIAQHESVSHALAVIERLGYESGMYDTYIRTDSNIISKHPRMTDGKPASGGPSLANVDAIFFLGHREVQLDPGQKADLLSFVKDDGKGFVAGTHSDDGVPVVAGIRRAAGCALRRASLEYGPRHRSSTRIPRSRRPSICRRASAFTEDFYQARDYSREKIRVVLRLDVSKMPATRRRSFAASDGDFPLAWAKRYGKGRVFYSAFGHARERRGTTPTSNACTSRRCWSLGLTEADATPRPISHF